MKNRSRVETFYDIVSAARQPGTKKTHLMYKSNLSYGQLDLFLDFLLQAGLLEERFVDESRMYCVTKKGVEFMRIFEELSGLLMSKTSNVQPNTEAKIGDQAPAPQVKTTDIVS